jgi:hypothetical protein
MKRCSLVVGFILRKFLIWLRTRRLPLLLRLVWVQFHIFSFLFPWLGTFGRFWLGNQYDLVGVIIEDVSHSLRLAFNCLCSHDFSMRLLIFIGLYFALYSRNQVIWFAFFDFVLFLLDSAFGAFLCLFFHFLFSFYCFLFFTIRFIVSVPVNGFFFTFYLLLLFGLGCIFLSGFDSFVSFDFFFALLALFFLFEFYLIEHAKKFM